MGRLGGKLRARGGTWLDVGVPGIWQARWKLEPGGRQKPGNSGFMRWRLNGVGEGSGARQQEQAAGMSWNQDKCFSQEASHLPLAKVKCSTRNRAPGPAGVSRAKRLTWRHGLEELEPREGLAFSFSLWEGNLFLPLFLELTKQFWLRKSGTNRPGSQKRECLLSKVPSTVGSWPAELLAVSFEQYGKVEWGGQDETHPGSDYHTNSLSSTFVIFKINAHWLI